MKSKYFQYVLFVICLSSSSVHSDYEEILDRLMYDEHRVAWCFGARRVLNLMIENLNRCDHCLSEYFNFMIENRIQGIRIWRLYHYLSNESLIHFIGIIQDGISKVLTPEAIQEMADLKRHDIKPNFEIHPNIHLFNFHE
ncbi:hypothetical protein [Endozoicomonas sp. ALC020]|uniref:hypothetical protein n=1 Tax=Endozoicomonas sp. ALC020 TaxID=3403077 RepID=UPI003BB1A0A9